MSHNITRCPKCKTSFRVTAAQLDSAKGAVRCGSCLFIFDARANFIQPPPVSPRPVANKPPTTITEAPTSVDTAAPTDSHEKTSSEIETSGLEESFIAVPNEPAQAMSEFNALADDEPATQEDEDILISDDMNDEKNQDDFLGLGALAPEFDDSRRWAEQSHSLFESTPKPEKRFGDDEKNVDESWAEALLDDLDEDAPFDEVTEEAPDERLKREIDNRFDGRQTGSFDVMPDDFDTDFESFLAEEPLSDEPTNRKHKEQESEAFDWQNEREDDYSLDQLDDAELTEHLVTEREDKHNLLDAFEPEPLELTYKPQDRRWLVKSAWITGCVLLVVLLFLQIGYLKFDSWSRTEPYRQWYAAFCPMLGCELPSRQDTSKIRLSLVVRANPDEADTLAADAIVINTADFEQPFPIIALRFSDLDGAPISEHKFQPEDYLRGELAGFSQMPPGQPVQINLSLADPGSNAVNYQAYIPSSNN